MNDHERDVDAVLEDCIDWCTSCHNICTETVMYSLTVGGKHAEPSHVRLLMDCAQICQTAADFMLRESDLHGVTCEACAQVCDRCAEACEKFTESELMQAVAETCRQCAATCREMARLAKAA